MKIAGRAELTDRFLIVKGDIRTYKIHLGSVFLPFEGDQTLAVIPSKAFLLAEDKKISDPSITRQLRNYS